MNDAQGFDPQSFIQALAVAGPEGMDALAEQLAGTMPPPPPGGLQQLMALNRGAGGGQQPQPQVPAQQQPPAPPMPGGMGPLPPMRSQAVPQAGSPEISPVRPRNLSSYL